MIRIEQSPFDERKYLINLVGLLARKKLVAVQDLSAYNQEDISDMMTACFDSSINESIFDDILAANPNYTTSIYRTLDTLIAKKAITKRQIVELHRKFGTELGKYILTSNKNYYQTAKESIVQSPEVQMVIKKYEAYQDAVRLSVQQVLVDTDACLFLAQLASQAHLDIEGLKLIDITLGRKIEEIQLGEQVEKSYFTQTSIQQNGSLIAILAIACYDIGLDLDAISAVHRPLGSKVGAALFAKTDY